MSKRYGRNQKNRHREKIKRLEEKNKNLEHSKNEIKKVYTHNRDQLDDIISLIERFNPNSTLLPPKKERVDRMYDRYRVAAKQQIDVNPFKPDSIAEYVECTTIDLYLLETCIRKNIENFQTHCHLILSSGEHVAYAISREAMMNTPTKVIVERLLPDITCQLVKHMQKGLKDNYGR